MPLKLYTDVHLNKAIARQLRAQGADLIRGEDVGLHDATDFEHLEFATREGRAIITSDDDFLTLAAQWREQGREHAGIFFVLAELTNRGEAAIGPTVTFLAFWHEAVEAGAASLEKDVYNQVIYISG